MTQYRTAKKIITGITAVIVVSVFSTVSAHAGSARRHTVEGIVLGAGLTILGSALIHELNGNRSVHEHQCRKTIRSLDRESHSHDFRSLSRYRDDHYRHNPNHDRYDRENDHRDDYHYRENHHKPGHWEIRKIWVAPEYKKIWVNDRCRKGRRIPGHWKRILIKNGYHKRVKVWVALR